MIYIFIFYIGCCLSSFAFCFSYDWVHANISFTRRSQCDHCGHILHLIDLLPIVAVLFTCFRCRYCRRSISRSYIITELLGGLVTLIIYRLFPYQPLVYSLLFSVVILLMVFCDIHKMMVPDLLQLSLLLLCFYDTYIMNNFIVSQLLFAIVIFTLLVSLNFIKPNSIGGADIKTLTILAFFIPMRLFPLILFTSSFLALLYIVVSRPSNKYNSSPLPFIPFIFIGFLVIYSFS